MAQSSLECANIALTKIGAAKITDLSDTTETAITANLCIDPCKKDLLRLHPWNFAVKRTLLRPTETDITNVTEDGSTGWFKIWTGSTTGLSSGDAVTIEDVVGAEGANGTFQIDAVVAGTSFLLRDEDFSGAWTSGGTWTKAGLFDFSYNIALPSDCLRILRVMELEQEDYRIEAGRILINDHPVEMKYIYDVTDYTTMDPSFYDLLSTALALKIAYKISQSSTLVEQLSELYRRQLGKVRHVDATEDPAEALGADDWINSRFPRGSGWPMRLS
jgi:hypothetical protein